MAISEVLGRVRRGEGVDDWGLIWDEELGRKEDVETGRKREEQGKTREWGEEEEEEEIYSQKNLKK